MYTSSDHIIIEKQILNNNNYIRIITVSDTVKYFDEIKKIYNFDDPFYHIIYNSGDFYNRLLHDIQFKKFKNTNMKIISKNIFLIPNENHEWFVESLIPWIKNKIHTYIEDEDEEYFDIIPEHENWMTISEDHKVIYKFDAEKTEYELLNLEINKDLKYVLTRNHLLSLILKYANNNYGSIVGLPNNIKKTIKETEEVKSTNKIDKLKSFILDKIQVDQNLGDIQQWINTQEANSLLESIIEHTTKEKESNIDKSTFEYYDNNRGCLLYKNKLTTDEVESLFKFLGVSNTILIRIINNKDYGKIAINTSLNDDIFSDPFKFSYAFIDETIPIETLNDYSQVFGSSPILNETKKSEENNVEKGKFIYKNIIDNNIYIFDNSVIYLDEFEKLANLNCKTELVLDILDKLNKNNISSTVVSELKELVKIFDNIEIVNPIPVISSTNKDWSQQKLLTKQYVDLYKNDSLETLAATVIENVVTFMNSGPTTIALSDINKNQIGKDLVDLGVKKIRKSKGYVYGIQDTKKDTFMPSILPEISCLKNT